MAKWWLAYGDGKDAQYGGWYSNGQRWQTHVLLMIHAVAGNLTWW